VNRVVPKASLLAETERYVGDIARNAPLDDSRSEAGDRGGAAVVGERDAAAVARMIAACFESEDYAEACGAFLEKRRPKFSGR
jgi:enoyl-CoA hydratase/carnithine racemase